eukprot:359491-Chlamydomonas_euryale.AAC.9
MLPHNACTGTPRSSGGITFVLNSGNRWLHEKTYDKDWYVQLSGQLPLTTDINDLPDAEVCPVPMAPPETSEQEEADRATLRAHPERLAVLKAKLDAVEADERAAVSRHNAAVADANAAHQARRAAEQRLVDAQAFEQRSGAAVLAARAAAADAVAAVPKCEAAMGASRNAAAAAAAAAAAMADAGVTGSMGAAAQAAQAAADAAQQAAITGVEAARAAVTRTEAAVQKAIADAERAVAELKEAHAAAAVSANACGPLDGAATAAALVRHEAVAAADAMRSETADEVSKLTAVADAARSRVSAAVCERQAHLVMQHAASDGPDAPINLSWLLPPTMTGRNLPMLPSEFNDVRTIVAKQEEDFGMAVVLAECSVHDLQSVARGVLRKALGLSSLQQLHVKQDMFSVALPGGDAVPMVAWVTCAEAPAPVEGAAPAAPEPPAALVAIVVDARAAGKLRGLLQLHWGVSHREGQPPTRVPPNAATSSETNWEVADGCMATPFHPSLVPNLGIGRRARSSRASSPQQPESVKVAQVVTLHLPADASLADGGLSFGLKDASGCMLLDAASRRHFFVDAARSMGQARAHSRQAAAALVAAQVALSSGASMSSMSSMSSMDERGNGSGREDSTPRKDVVGSGAGGGAISNGVPRGGLVNVGSFGAGAPALASSNIVSAESLGSRNDAGANGSAAMAAEPEVTVPRTMPEPMAVLAALLGSGSHDMVQPTPPPALAQPISVLSSMPWPTSAKGTNRASVVGTTPAPATKAVKRRAVPQYGARPSTADDIELWCAATFDAMAAKGEGKA